MSQRKVCITGGAGYVGSALIPYLLQQTDWDLVVFDTFWFGDHLPAASERLLKVRGDIRDIGALERAFADCDAVVHLACISNDPSSELKPALTKDINLSCFPRILRAAERSLCKHFVFASSSSVYGVHEQGEVTEQSDCNPLTDYSKYKLECEELLRRDYSLPWTVIRPATVCGWAPRLRLDVVVNAMTASAKYTGKLTVHGGPQLRPNLHVKDMCRAYHRVLTSVCAGETFNVGAENLSLAEIALRVQEVAQDRLQREVPITYVDSNDKRSYHVNSDRIADRIGFIPTSSVDDAVTKLWDRLPSRLSSRYYNIKRMQELPL